MSLTSYRAAPPRVKFRFCFRLWTAGFGSFCLRFFLFPFARALRVWRRPTLPRLLTKYHWRWGFSRPSSGWDRVRSPRHGRQTRWARVFLKAGRGLRFRARRVCVFLSGRFHPHGLLSVLFFPVSCNGSGQAVRAISMAWLHPLPGFHLPPIDVVVFHGPDGEHLFRGWLPA